ncbi:hypothetical protein PGT21_019168 [Puccinia graminis f. sp. tritici]|uniref:Uncharacterized protein n=1 Tax=Puccinia graminis f. sp. tritici TaxID=56615 RepID=A0A5B0Q3A3_PUCGR|nr:hypothetical protein PGT21_019168 [Puccinia graminis f. sp. tritici]
MEKVAFVLAILFLAVFVVLEELVNSVVVNCPDLGSLSTTTFELELVNVLCNGEAVETTAFGLFDFVFASELRSQSDGTTAGLMSNLPLLDFKVLATEV